MITNPYLPSPAAAQAWAEGFVKGLAGPQYSTEPPPEVAPDDVSAFAQGVMAGQQSAIDGFAPDEPCVNAAVETHNPGSDAGHLIDAAHILHGLWEARHLATLAGGLAGIAAGFIVLAATLPVQTLPPEEVLPQLGQSLVDALSAYGVDSLELFCGAGLDPSNVDCEIMMSPMFVSFDQARQAALAMGRPEWAVASWRTDQSRSFRIVEAS